MVGACDDPYADNGGGGGGGADATGDLDEDTDTDTDAEPPCDAFCQSGGQQQWTWRNGGSGSDLASGLTLGPDGSVYGAFSIKRSTYDRDLLLAKLDEEDGREIWTALKAEGANNGLAWAGTADGLIAAGGPFALGVDPRDGASVTSAEMDIILGRLLISEVVTGTEGVYIFEKRGDDFEDQITVHEIGPEGLLRSVDVAPYEVVDVVRDDTGHLFMAAIDNRESERRSDRFARGLILEVDADLEVVGEWTLPELPRRIALGPGRTLLTLGDYDGEDGVCERVRDELRLYSVGETLTEQWTYCTDASIVSELAVGPDGDAVLAYRGFDDSDPLPFYWTDVVVLEKVGVDGSRRWQREFSIDGVDTSASAIVINAENEIFVAGRYLVDPGEESFLDEDTNVFVTKFSR